IDGFLMVNQVIRDSGIVRDPYAYSFDNNQFNTKNLQSGWTYEPAGNLWCEGPDTNAVMTAKVITGRQFQSRSIGMSFPTFGTFRNRNTKIKANGKFCTPDAVNNPILTGGPLRKIQIVFGQSSMSYRFIPMDTNLTNLPCADMVSVPFSVFALDELDSSGGVPRQLNTGFLDYDNNGFWDPDTSALGNYNFTYILASNYSSNPDPNYLNKNPGSGSPTSGFNSMDIMYAWMPRAKKSPNGVPLNFTNGDKLTVSPYRISRPDFVPGFPVKYNWTVQGTSVNTSSINANNINNIKAFPNPYYGYSTLEYDSGGEKFIYFSNLPLQCNIYIYSLNGSLVKTINRNVNDPGDSLEKWDLQNSGGSNVASGMYIVLVDCKNLGAKTLKIAVFTSK
ncbi:MAG TPA: T9SS type A sorting domain-containing protein, partial [Ignavibacteria bacterium]|nr:T9SS type A sorting domain-containing protein [Ignavibacteria bacterium]